MAPQAPSAIDCIGPAFERVKWLLIKPFRWAVWWRLAIIALAISGSGLNVAFRIPDLLHAARRGRQDLIPWSDISQQPHFMALVTLLIFLIALLVFVHLYVSSVLRFVLFDAVATGRYRLREGWKKWHGRGLHLFLLQLVLMLVYLAVFVVLFGLPILYGITSGWFHTFQQHPAQVFGLVLLALPAILAVAVISYVVFSMAFDFTVPILALEQVSGGAAFGRVWGMLRAAKGAYAGYLGMKFVVTIAMAMVIGIVNAMVFVLFLIPMAVVAIGASVASPDLWHSPANIAAAVTGFAVFLLFMMFVGGVLEVPLITFVESYALTFFAGRYPLLWDLLYPALPPAPQSEPLPAI